MGLLLALYGAYPVVMISAYKLGINKIYQSRNRKL